MINESDNNHVKQMGEEFIQEKRRIEKEMQDQERGGE